MNNEETKIPLFRRCVLQNFPFIEQDFDALTDYALLCKVVEYLNKVITATNENSAQFEALTVAFNNLKSYIDHYFDNLDVQEEINNKLDKMAQDGSLSQIIGTYVDPFITAQNEIISLQNDRINSNSTSIETLSGRMDEFTSLTEGSTTGDAELADIRVGENGKTYTNAGSAVRANDKISQDILKLNEMYILDSLVSQQGSPNSAGNWANTSANYYVKFIPVNAGDSYAVKCTSTSYIGFITDNNVPTVTNGGTINYVDGTARINLSQGNSYEAYGVVPSTAHFMYIQSIYNSTTISYNYVKINEHDYININKLNLEKITNSAVNSFKQNEEAVWTVGTVTGSVGNHYVDGYNLLRRKNPYPQKYPYDVYITSDGIFKFSIVYLDNSFNVTSQTNYGTETLQINKNTYFRVILADNEDQTTDISALTNTYINQHIQIVNKDFYEIINKNKAITTNWCALGDSITYGFYSYINSEDEPDSGTDRRRCWASLLAKQNGYTLTNKAVGGQGYLDPENQSLVKGYEYVDTLDFSDYNLVTLAYGINDWKGNQVVGSYTDDSDIPSTVCGAMKHCIKHIMESNPNCKIVVLLPMNAWGYSFNYGNYNTNYGLGYSFANSGTLDSFSKKLIEVCDYYGIEYVDLTHYSPINRENLPSLLLDGVHPSLECHKLIANNLKFKI